MNADLVGHLYYESNAGKVAAGGELGSEWHLRVQQASPNAQHLVGHTLEVHPVDDIKRFAGRLVAINAVLERVGVSQKRTVVRIAGISVIG